MRAGKKVLTNSFFLYILTISNFAAGLLIFPYLGRVLSVEVFGVVGLGMAFALVFQSIVEYGFLISGTARISKLRDDLSKVSVTVSTILFCKIILMIIAVLLFFGASSFVASAKESVLTVFLFVMSSIALAMAPDFYFRGIEKMQSIAIRSLLSKCLALGLILLVVKSDDDVNFVPISLLIGNLIYVSVAYIQMYRSGVELTKPTKLIDQCALYLKEGFMYFLSRIAATLNQAAGAFTLGLMGTDFSKSLGLFTGAWRISSAGEMLLLPVTDSLYPHMVNKKDYKLFWKFYIRGLLVWTLGCTGVFLLAPEICSIILGESFRDAGDVLRILIFGAFFAYTSIMFGYPALTPIGQAWHANFSLVIGLILNILMLSILFVTNNVTLSSVSIVVASINCVLVVYRGTILFIHRSKMRAQDEVLEQ